ncbi:hypothetical protein L6R50_08310 [Myxococcota bacterium]|nr:hypothetical protein [Myxococcota bacterium]
MEAELRAALAREKVPAGCDDLTAGLTWVHPDRPLGPECARILSHGYVCGAVLWHLACAPYLSPRPSDLHFATLDTRQGEVECAVGFPALGRPPG